MTLQKVLAGIAVFVVCFGLTYFLRSRVSPPPAAPHARPALPQLPAPSSREQEMGIVRAPVRHDEKNLLVDVSIHVFSRCEGGDWDFIQFELAHSATPRMLLSLEPVVADPSFPILTHPLTAADALAGVTHRFTFPRVTKPRALGLFLCKDTGGTGRCADKPFISPNAYFQESARVPPDYRAPDRTYYFQFLSFDAADSVGAFGRYDPTPRAFELLPEYVGDAKQGARIEG